MSSPKGTPTHSNTLKDIRNDGETYSHFMDDLSGSFGISIKEYARSTDRAVLDHCKKGEHHARGLLANGYYNRKRIRDS